MINLLKMKSIINGQVKVTVEPELKIGTSAGIIYAPELIDFTEIEIKENIKSIYEIVEVKRLNKGKEKIKTPLLKITFGIDKLPIDIKVGFINYKIDVYYPAPLRCYNCFKYGHVTKFCTKSKICRVCANNHEEMECEGKIKCINCGLEHFADDKCCKIYKQEKEIVKIKIDQNISFKEARVIFKNSNLEYEKGTENSAITKSLEKTISQEIKKIPMKIDENLQEQILNGIKKVINITIEKAKIKEMEINKKSNMKTYFTTEAIIENQGIDKTTKLNEQEKNKVTKKLSSNEIGNKDKKIENNDDKIESSELIKLNNGTKIIIDKKKISNRVQNTITNTYDINPSKNES